jgi:dipeptidyl aminopeptidase/acylaminoacyl peptidase
MAYLAIGDRKSFIVSGETRGEPFDVIYSVWNRDGTDQAVLWAPDGHAFSYIARNDKDVFVVVGTKKLGPYTSVSYIRWSPDSRRLAFEAKIAEDRFVVVDERRGEIFDDVSNVTFSPDGKSVAYVAKEGSKQFIMRDGQRLPSYGAVSARPSAPTGRPSRTSPRSANP